MICGILDFRDFDPSGFQHPGLWCLGLCQPHPRAGERRSACWGYGQVSGTGRSGGSQLHTSVQEEKGALYPMRGARMSASNTKVVGVIHPNIMDFLWSYHVMKYFLNFENVISICSKTETLIQGSLASKVGVVYDDGINDSIKWVNNEQGFLVGFAFSIKSASPAFRVYSITSCVTQKSGGRKRPSSI